MVQLHTHFETSYAIYLMLEYASGGKLWSCISGYYQHSVDTKERYGSKDYPGVDREESKKGSFFKDDGASIQTSKEEASVRSVGDSPSFEVIDDMDDNSHGDQVSGADRLGVAVAAAEASSALIVEGGKVQEPGLPGTPANVGTPSIEVIEDPLRDKTLPEQISVFGAKRDEQMTSQRKEAYTEKKSALNAVIRDPKRADTRLRSYNPNSVFARLDAYYASPAHTVPEQQLRLWAAEIVLALSHLHASAVTCRYRFL